MTGCLHVNTLRAETMVETHAIYLPATEGESCFEQGTVFTVRTRRRLIYAREAHSGHRLWQA
jgi:hypothetical protein